MLETSIALSLMAVGVIATLQMRAAQVESDSARAVAQMYERLNQAAGNYMTLYYDQLVAKGVVDATCGKLPYRVGGHSDIPGDYNYVNCKIDLNVSRSGASKNTVPIANFLQPSLAELSSLGLLPGYSANMVPMPSSDTFTTYGRAGVKADNSFHVLIQLMCVGGDAPGRVITDPAMCKDGSRDLQSLVFNLQPLAVGEGLSPFTVARIQEFAGGGQTYVSTERQRKLTAFAGSPDGSIDNPLVMSKNETMGAPNIIAVRNGYGSSREDAFVRKDGSTPLTGNWDVGGKNITNAGVLGAGTLSANSVVAGTGVFGAFTKVVDAALKATTAYFSGNVTVGGELTVVDKTRLGTDLVVSGATELVGSVKVRGPSNLWGGLSVKGLGEFLDGLKVSGFSELLGGLKVNGASNLTGTLTVSELTKLDGGLNVPGTTSLVGATSVNDFKLGTESILGGGAIRKYRPWQELPLLTRNMAIT